MSDNTPSLERLLEAIADSILTMSDLEIQELAVDLGVDLDKTRAQFREILAGRLVPKEPRVN